MEKLNYQYVIAGILLLIAVIYVIRNIVRSIQHKGDCADCGIPIQKKPFEHKK